MSATLRYQRCARIYDALSRVELELENAWIDAWTDLPLPDRDDELADFCKATLERVRTLKRTARLAMDRNRLAAWHSREP